MKKKLIPMLLFLVSQLMIGNLSFGQDIKTGLSEAIPSQSNITLFTPDELNKKWTEFTGNTNWQILQRSLSSRKFSRILNKEASWGFTGTVINDRGEKVSVLLCLFDFINPANIKQGCSMLWAKVGT